MAPAHDLRARPDPLTVPSSQAGLGLPGEPPRPVSLTRSASAAAGGPGNAAGPGIDSSEGPARAGRPSAEPEASWLWLGYLGTGVIGVGCLEFVPAVGGWLVLRLVASGAVGTSSAAAVFIGLRRHRPCPRTPWLLIGISQLIVASVDVIFCVTDYLLGDQRNPGLVDMVYLAHYPVLVAGLLPIVRLRTPGGDLPALLDGMLVATGATTVSVLYLIGPSLHENLSPLLAVTAIGFPIADLVVLSIGLRLVFGTDLRPPAFLLLSASLFSVLAADLGCGLRQLRGGYTFGGPLDAAWMLGDLALGAAALHPTMARIAQPAARPAELGRARLCGLYLAGITGPLSLIEQRGQADGITQWVTALATVVSVALIMVRMRYAEVRQRQLANTDPLTGLCTRRFLETRLALAAVRAGQPGATIAVLLVDVDHFKSINDRFGHPAGDRALAEVARRLRAVARSADVLARYGGEEFALLTSGAGHEDLRVLGERLRIAVAASPVAIDDGAPLPVTVSVGAAATTLPASPAELIDRADRALYAAKAAGRDRCVLAASAPTRDEIAEGDAARCSPAA